MDDDIRPGEIAVTPPAATDAGLLFIGRIHTPWTARGEAPHQGHPDGPVCRIEVFEPWIPALDGLERCARIEGDTMLVRGLDCLDGTPLLYLKPERKPVPPP